MRSKLNREIETLLKKHGCQSYFVMLIDPDSTDVWSLWDGNRQWIYGEIERWQKILEDEWTEKEEDRGY